MTDIIHKPHPGGQERFLASSVDELFIGGEKGNGKSWLLLQEVLYDIEHRDGHAILFRRTTVELEDLWHKTRDHYAGYHPKYNDQKHLVTFPSGFRLRMSHLQYPSDVFTHTGQEYHLIMFDELPNFPKFTYQFMKSCLRTVNPELKTRMRSTGNPVGEGIAHVKAAFIDSMEPYEIGYFKTDNDRDVKTTADDPDAMSRMWIPGIRAENITLMKADPDYERKLNSLPEKLKRAFKYGIWDSSDTENQIIRTQDWQRALNGVDIIDSTYAHIGADYALSRDKCTIASGRGNRVSRFTEFDGMDHIEFADKIEYEMSIYGKYQVVTAVDANGPGSGVYTELTHRGHVNLFPCMYKDFSFEAKQNKNDIVKLRFDNFRSMAIWKLGDDLRYGRVDLSDLTGKIVDDDGNPVVAGYYDNLHLLEEEALAHTYKMNGDKIIIIPKSELKKVQMSDGTPGLGRSPDRFDALVYWNWIRDRKPSIPVKPGPYSGQDYDIQTYGKKQKKTRSPWV